MIKLISHLTSLTLALGATWMVTFAASAPAPQPTELAATAIETARA
jgi:hypothetical protein